MLTNVPSFSSVNVHAMVVASVPAPISTTIRRLGSIALTATGTEKPYMSQCHSTRLPGSSLPLPRVNQNRLVTAGSTKASNTSSTGLRIRISALATGTLPGVRFAISLASLSLDDVRSEQRCQTQRV